MVGELAAGFGGLAAGQSILVSEVTAAMLGEWARDEQHLDLLRQVGLGSVMLVPLRVRGRTIGVLGLGACRTRPAYGEADLVFVEDLAIRVAATVDHARSFANERATAETLARALLPGSLPVVPGLEIAERYVAAAEGTRVGGDWYDVIRLTDGHVLLTVGDVVGRGPTAAAVMGQLRTLMHEAALREDDPRSVVCALDAMATRTPEAFASTCVAIDLDPLTGLLRYCRAGHPFPLVVGGAEPRWLDAPGGSPLGVGTQRPCPATTRLETGEILVLFTDGVVERRGVHPDVGLSRLARVAQAAAQGGPAAVCDAILGLASVSSADDDMALLVVQRT